MCGSRAAQREQRSGDGEGRCSPPRTAAVRGALTSTLGTLEQAQRPLSASPGDLLLVLDVPSAAAGPDNTVIWDVIQMRTGPRNTFNVKLVPTRST